MTDSIKQKLCKVLALCVEIDMHNMYFDFRYRERHNLYWLNISPVSLFGRPIIDIVADPATDENLDSTIQKLEALKAEWTKKGE